MKQIYITKNEKSLSAFLQDSYPLLKTGTLNKFLRANKIKVNGKKEIVSVKLTEEVVDPDDIEMLQDLIVAATNEALRQAEEAASALMGKMTGGLGGGFPF